jgi:uncharacterized protein (TIGR02646 family)
MIKITRPARVPDLLDSNAVKDTEKDIKTIVERNGRAQSEEFTKHWTKDEVREALYEMQFHKCCYCEQKREMKYESDVEHYRPKARVEGDKTHPGYWWLAYKWENLFFSCKVCNSRYKLDHFPVEVGSKRSAGPNQPHHTERRLLLHPCDDDPEKELTWDVERDEADLLGNAIAGAMELALFVRVAGLTNRGHITVKTLGLNRMELLTNRALQVLTIDTLIEKVKIAEILNNEGLLKTAIRDIQHETAAIKPFAGLRRYLIRQAGLGRYLLPLSAAATAQPATV